MNYDDIDITVLNRTAGLNFPKMWLLLLAVSFFLDFLNETVERNSQARQ